MPSQIPQALEPDQLDVIVGKGNVDPPLEGRSWDGKADRRKAGEVFTVGKPCFKKFLSKNTQKTFQPIHLP